jgi:hypothetical protein
VGRDVGKAPLLPTYQEYQRQGATTADVDEWARRWPSANVALLLCPSRVVVIDCDDSDALAEASALGLPPAPTVLTSKGAHYYYCRPPGAPVSRLTKWGRSRAIDVLSLGYVIAPPSRHAGGRVYTWEVRPGAVPMVDAPRWAVEALARRGQVAEVKATPAALPASLPPVALADLRVSPRIRGVIVTGHDPIRYPSESEARFGVLQALVAVGYDDATITAVIFDPAHAIGAKPRRMGRGWFARELGRARAKSDVELWA